MSNVAPHWNWNMQFFKSFQIKGGGREGRARESREIGLNETVVS